MTSENTKVINFKKEENKNFVDYAADWLDDVKKKEAVLGFYLLQKEDGTFKFDWYGDHMKVIGFLDYAKTVISNYVIEKCEED